MEKNIYEGMKLSMGTKTALLVLRFYLFCLKKVEKTTWI